MIITNIINSMPDSLKVFVRKNWNTDGHAKMYGVLEDWVMTNHCIYEDGTIYKIGKKIAGA
jgi:hypothetical protein